MLKFHIFNFWKLIIMLINFSELNPLKPYVQTCKNCISSCTAALSVQTSQKISTNCNTTCDDCNNVYYNPVTEECKQFQCDYPVAIGKGSTLMRKTANPGISSK
jgi:hypothetical protein